MRTMKLKYWFCSFGNPAKPKGQQAYGAVVVYAEAKHAAGLARNRLPMFHPSRLVCHVYEVPADGPEVKELRVGRFVHNKELAELGYTKA